MRDSQRHIFDLPRTTTRCVDRRHLSSDLTDEINFTYDVSDEALETAAGSVRGRAGAFTLSFCSGLDTCGS